MKGSILPRLALECPTATYVNEYQVSGIKLKASQVKQSTPRRLKFGALLFNSSLQVFDCYHQACRNSNSSGIIPHHGSETKGGPGPPSRSVSH